MPSNIEPVTLVEYKELSDQFFQNLNGDNAKVWLNVYRLLHNKENPWDIRLWDPWKTISYGGEDATSENLRRLCSRDNKKALCVESIHILKSLMTTPKKKFVEIIIVPGKLLGINTPVSIYELNKRVVDLGFHLLTPELVYNLHYQIYGYGEVLRVAMKPIPFSDGKKKTFSVGKVITSCAAPEAEWIGSKHMIVMVKKFL